MIIVAAQNRLMNGKLAGQILVFHLERARQISQIKKKK
jgi:hypothetical protein